MKKTKHLFRRIFMTFVAALFALSFLMPTVLTISNSFMTQSEINSNYGSVFTAAKDGKTYISEAVNLKFIPDKVTFSHHVHDALVIHGSVRVEAVRTGRLQFV